MTDVKTQLVDLAGRVDDNDAALLAVAVGKIAELERRQIPPSWSSPDGTEWSGLSGDGVLDVRGSKADIDVVVSWRQAKDRLAWFESEYAAAQARESALKAEVERLKTEADGEFVQAAVRVMQASPGFIARDYAEDGISADDFESFFTEDMNEAWRQVEEWTSRTQNFENKLADQVVATRALQAKYDRLLTAFHDATRRPLGVTPDSGLEFYDARMADEAEARRSRYGRGPK